MDTRRPSRQIMDLPSHSSKQLPPGRATGAPTRDELFAYLSSLALMQSHSEIRSQTDSSKRLPDPKTIQAKRKPSKRGDSTSRSHGRITFSLANTSYPISRFERDLKSAAFQEDYIVVALSFEAALTSDGSGIIQNVYSNLPTSVSNWSSFVAIWDEYRVLNFRVRYTPTWSTGGSSATYWPAIAVVVDRNDATALTGYTSAAMRFASAKEFQTQKPFFTDCPMSLTSEEDGFIGTASGVPVATNWIKYYATGATPSLTIGRVMTTLLIQFRGRGLT